MVAKFSKLLGFNIFGSPTITLISFGLGLFLKCEQRLTGFFSVALSPSAIFGLISLPLQDSQILFVLGILN